MCYVVKSTTQKFYIARLKGVLDKYAYLLSDQLSVFELEFQILIFFFKIGLPMLEDWRNKIIFLALLSVCPCARLRSAKPISRKERRKKEVKAEERKTLYRRKTKSWRRGSSSCQKEGAFCWRRSAFKSPYRLIR